MQRDDPAPGRVLICGAGPTGLVTAIKLARAGVAVDIVDRRTEPSPLSKAAAVWRRTLEVLHGDVPVDRFLERGRILHGVRIGLRDRLLRQIDFGGRSGRFPTGLLIPQAETESLLIEALSSLGIEIRRGVELTGFVAESGGVRVDLRTADAEEAVEYDWLIGADGARSAVRHGLGVRFPGSTVAHRWLLGDLDFEEPGDEDWMSLYFADDGLAAMFPYGGGRWRLVADGGPVASEVEPRDPDLAEIESVLRERTGVESRIVGTTWLAEFRINERIVDSYRHGRVLLVGDAAHIHSPLGGQGMNTCIQDAVNLAWKLALVVRGEADETLLDTYEAERRPVGAAVVKITTRALDLAMSRNLLARLLQRHVMPSLLGLRFLQRRVVRLLSEIAIDYRRGPLARTAGDRWAGRRLPDLPSRAGGCSVYDEIDDRGFTILAFGEKAFTPEGGWGEAIRAAGPQVTVVRVAKDAVGDSPLRAGWSLAEGGIAVVRPDSYLGPVTTDAARVVAWFRAMKTR